MDTVELNNEVMPEGMPPIPTEEPVTKTGFKKAVAGAAVAGAAVVGAAATTLAFTGSEEPVAEDTDIFNAEGTNDEVLAAAVASAPRAAHAAEGEHPAADGVEPTVNPEADGIDVNVVEVAEEVEVDIDEITAEIDDVNPNQFAEEVHGQYMGDEYLPDNNEATAAVAPADDVVSFDDI